MSNSERKKENPNLDKSKQSIEESALFQSDSEGVSGLDALKEETKANKSTDSSNSTSTKDSTKDSTEKDTIRLEKKEKPSLIQRAYYLKPEQVHVIDRLAEETGMDKSELVRRALDEFIKRVEY